jgi:HD-GYP domain-containing protein (c-di-GMP phosphodiesterase class II)
VPLPYGSKAIGVIVISTLGIDQFDEDDVRLLEVLAGHAAVALENARLYESQRREAESATALLEFTREVSEAQGIAEVADRVVLGSARILSSPSASLWLQDAATGDLIRLAQYSDDPAAGGSTTSVIPASLLAPWLGRTEPYFIDAADYAAIATPPENTDGRYAVAPFTVDGRWGVIAAAIPPATIFAERELDLLGGLAQQAKLALQSASSYETLERTFLSTVEALANALEANDEYTSSHARWITDLALKVGRELGLEPTQLKRLELGALFHDIGKIGIPSSILLKPGPLTAAERAVIETHPLLGERILEPIEQLHSVRQIVRSCHERWDGAGYPDRLQGDEIPIESRIIIACDAFHAMTTDRPYRKALGAEEARRRLQDASGSQFDPDVVDALIRVLGDCR